MRVLCDVMYGVSAVLYMCLVYCIYVLYAGFISVTNSANVPTHSPRPCHIYTCCCMLPPVANGMRKTWKPPQRDATDVIISRILDSDTTAPHSGFSQETFLKLQTEQSEFLRSEWMTIKASRKSIHDKVDAIIAS